MIFANNTTNFSNKVFGLYNRKVIDVFDERSNTEARAQQIEARAKQIPDMMDYFKTYAKAITGRSRKAAMKAQCLECYGWEREEVRNCTDLACPLYSYRPYRDLNKGSKL